MQKVYYGTKDEPFFKLEPGAGLIAVRTRNGESISRQVRSSLHRQIQEACASEPIASFPDAGVEVYRLKPAKAAAKSSSAEQRRQEATEALKTSLRQDPNVRFAGRVLVEPQSGSPVLYTENIFIQFTDNSKATACKQVLQEAGLTIKRKISYAKNAYFVEAAEGTGQEVFALAERLLQRPDVLYCHPELIRPRARKKIYAQQWHLAKTKVNQKTVDAHANVKAAHKVTQGQGITIAIIDDGVDTSHEEFQGAGKVVFPRDVTLKRNDASPGDGDSHGTACAGVACANGSKGASGVAPKARLMPIRFASGLGSQDEADAFAWAVDHGADVISCSWGPQDGVWWRPSDPLHKQKTPLPASSRLAIDYATTQGRGGKGCVLLFAAGNGNESADNDGYISYTQVIAVAACNDQSQRSVYSDYGQAVWCAFPSSDFYDATFNPLQPLTPGIWTTDRSGKPGYNAGSSKQGDALGHYTNSFGGTSSACPGAAGVAALILSAAPGLSMPQVREVLRLCCDKIDTANGQYSAAGHSPWYGHGRLNAGRAVALAKIMASPVPKTARKKTQKAATGKKSGKAVKKR